MSDQLNLFWETFLIESISLLEKYDQLEEREWTPITGIAELIVQIGHLNLVCLGNESCSIKSQIKEPFRELNNIGDEIADVILQCYSLLYRNKWISFNSEADDLTDEASISILNRLSCITILAGQIADSMLRVYSYKEKILTLQEEKIFIGNRIIRIIKNLFIICKMLELSPEEVYLAMLKDAKKSQLIREMKRETEK